MNTARHSFAIYRLADVVYVFGGFDNMIESECYSIHANTWSRLPELPFPVAEGTAARVGFRIYVAGTDSQIAAFDPFVVNYIVLEIERMSAQCLLYSDNDGLLIVSGSSTRRVVNDRVAG
jgi:hypothetical protein